PERATRAPGGRRSHRDLGGKALGGAPGRSLRGASWSAGGNGTATGALAIAAFRGRYLHLRPCPEAVRSASPSGLRPAGLADRRTKPPNPIKPKYHVPANHPWRKPWRRTLLSGTNPDISTLR